MWNSAQREKFNFVFQVFSASINKISFWQGDWALVYGSMKFRQFLDISWFPKTISLFFFLCGHWGPPSAKSEVIRQLVYTMFISNNHPSFHLWWKENLVNHLRGAKYYETDCCLFSDGFNSFINNVSPIFLLMRLP